MNIEAVVLTCPKYHQTRVTAIRNTWGQDIKVLFLSDLIEGNDVIGYPELHVGYDNVFLKYLALFKRYDNFNSDWYIFCDDDTFLNVKLIKEFLSNYNCEDNICIGAKCVLNSNGSDAYGTQTGFNMSSIQGADAMLPVEHPSGGSGFIISKCALKNLIKYLKNNNNIGRCYKSDVTFGFWLFKAETKIINCDKFNGNTPQVLNHTPEQVINNFSYHYVTEDLMKHLYAGLAQR